MMAKQNLLRAFKNAFAGIEYCARFERNIKIQIAAAFFAGCLAWWFNLDRYELAVLALTVASVLIVEMINTVVEAIVDIVSPEFHPLAKIAKDIAAGAVLISAAASLLIGYLLFSGKIWG